MTRFATTLIAATAILATSGIAQAQITATDTSTSLSVKMADLNLSTLDGQATLKRRIAHAASIVCGGANGDRSLQERAMFEKCRGKAFKDATLAAAAFSSTAVAAR